MEFFKRLFGIGPKVDWDDVRRSLDSKIIGLRKPAVRIVKTDRKTTSRFGGKPHADSDQFIWPESNGKPMAFLAQLDLSEIARQVKYEWLSDEGFVLIFYDVLEMPWGFDPKDRGKWCVLYQKTCGIEVDYPPHIDESAKIKSSFIAFRRVEILPDCDDDSVKKRNLTDEEIDLYIEADGEDEDGSPLHQIGGFPSPVQGNFMELESHLASNGIYLGDGKGFESKEAKALEAGAKEWKLLLQFDSDDDLDVMWGDLGMIYVWVQESKARQNQFDNCWLILQCG